MALAGTARASIEPVATSDRRVSLTAMLAALPDFAIAALFLRTWVAPDPARPTLGAQLMLVMLLEFVVVHSAAFMGAASIGGGPRGTRALKLVGIGLFYTLFVGGMALSFHQTWPLWSFWGLVANRMLSVLLLQPPDGDQRAFVQRQWAAGAVLYLLAVGLTTVVPLPRLGLSPDAVAALHLSGSGLWIAQPWRVLAAGTLYFAATGASELCDHRWIRATADLPARPSERRA